MQPNRKRIVVELNTEECSPMIREMLVEDEEDNNNMMGFQ
jgi:hypothetical protein